MVSLMKRVNLLRILSILIMISIKTALFFNLMSIKTALFFYIVSIKNALLFCILSFMPLLFSIVPFMPLLFSIISFMPFLLLIVPFILNTWILLLILKLFSPGPSSDTDGAASLGVGGLGVFPGWSLIDVGVLGAHDKFGHTLVAFRSGIIIHSDIRTTIPNLWQILINRLINNR
jgi:hypothetical protein